MKAIVNVHKDSYYKFLNGQTFEVKEIFPSAVGLSVMGLTIDFSFSEIEIVDLKKELESCNRETFEKLKRYLEINKIKIVKKGLDMGEMADYLFDLTFAEENRIEEEVQYILKKDNEYLYKYTSASESELIKGIREYYKERGKLSDKQRYCLARWIAQYNIWY